MASRITLAFLAAFTLGLTLGACGPQRSLCASVICNAGFACEETSGLCVRKASDGGTVDDGGASTDAGACATACVAPAVCDPATSQCVECLTDSSCTCPTPVCSSSKVCVALPADAGLTVPTGGETCALAPTLRTCGTAVTFTVDLSAAHDDFTSPLCGTPGSGGKDLAWTLVLDATFDVRVTATPAAGSSAQPIVSLRSGCDAATELSCKDSLGLGSSATFRLKSLPAGSYPLIIDSYDVASSGPVTVTVELLPPTLPGNETCATASALPNDGRAVTVDLSGATDDLVVSCNTKSDSPEVVYYLDVPAASDLTLSVTAMADAGIDPVVALRTSPCASGDELKCVDSFSSAAETVHARGLAAGRYYVIVEGYGRPGVGPITVTASLSAPVPAPPNDTCAAPRAISFAAGSNVASFTVDTSTANDDTVGSCNTTAPDSPEVVYALTLAAPRTVTVQSRASAGTTTDAVIYLRGDSCTATQPDGGVTTELGCDDAPPPDADTFTVSLPAGTYWLFVEGWGAGGAGPTDVTVTLAP